MEITNSELKEKLNNGEKVIVEFWAPWCGPCRMLKPIFEKVATNNTTDIRMYTMNIDNNREAGQSFGIRSIPTVKIFNSGELIETKVGMLSEQQINGIVTELING